MPRWKYGKKISKETQEDPLQGSGGLSWIPGSSTKFLHSCRQFTYTNIPAIFAGTKLLAQECNQNPSPAFISAQINIKAPQQAYPLGHSPVPQNRSCLLYLTAGSSVGAAARTGNPAGPFPPLPKHQRAHAWLGEGWACAQAAEDAAAQDRQIPPMFQCLWHTITVPDFLTKTLQRISGFYSILSGSNQILRQLHASTAYQHRLPCDRKHYWFRCQ